MLSARVSDDVGRVGLVPILNNKDRRRGPAVRKRIERVIAALVKRGVHPKVRASLRVPSNHHVHKKHLPLHHPLPVDHSAQGACVTVAVPFVAVLTDRIQRERTRANSAVHPCERGRIHSTQPSIEARVVRAALLLGLMRYNSKTRCVPIAK